MTPISIAGIPVGGGAPLVLFAGPCVVESRAMLMQSAARLKEITAKLGIPLVFKSSFKKANRTSISGFTGIDVTEAFAALKEVRGAFNLPIVTDIHTEAEAEAVAEFADVLQIPAFLSRQTDLLIAAGSTGKAVNIKKGQFMAPADMRFAAEKVASTGNSNILLCERGTSFGYHDLVVDMRGLVIMRSFGWPVVMDATHAVQTPSLGGISGGNREFALPLARAAAAVGIDALFVETHPDPASALSDAANQIALDDMEDFLVQVLAIDRSRRITQPETHANA
jgi:2-dehydro-3-deoxyphosphooctonate aldolase (KDO 8-P synthase)